MTIDWNLAATVVLSGLFVLFVTLIAVRAFVPKQSEQRDSGANIPIIQAAPGPAFVPVAVPMADSGAEIAAISAAIACYMDAAAPGEPYVVKQIVRRTPSGERPVWGFAGMLHNTRPF